MKRLFLIAVISMAVISLGFARGGQQQTTTGGRQNVDFWYLWGGDEGQLIEQIISAYNRSQSTYNVIGLSVPDQAKIITAISGGTGPDVTDDFHSNAPLYADEQIAEPLDRYITRDNLDTSRFVRSAYDLMRYNGRIYMLPLSVNINVLYYNKDLLARAGVTTLPRTLEDVQRIGRETTIVQNNQITQLGSCLVSGPDWVYSYTFANGTNFGSVGNLTPSNTGFRRVLDYIASEVAAFGSNAVNNFVTSGMSNIYSPQDPFLQGRQVFRVEGAWFYNMAKDAGINFDIMPVPGAASVGGEGYSFLGCSTMFIPTTARNKDGGWDFTKYITFDDGAKLFSTLKGDVPALTALATDRDVINVAPHMATYLQVVSRGTMIGLPLFTGSQEYSKAIMDAVTAVRLGGSVDRAIADMEAAVARIGR